MRGLVLAAALAAGMMTSTVAWAGADGAPDTPETPRPAEEGFDGVTGDWWGRRTWLRERGIEAEVRLTADYSHGLRGGMDTQHGAKRHLLDLTLDADLEKLVGWAGAKAFLNFQQKSGEDPRRIAGTFHLLSTIDTEDDRAQVSEAWVEQALWEGKLRVKAGKIDVTGDFAYVDHGSEFVNQYINWTATDGLMPTYPDPAFGALFVVEPAEWFYAGAGVWDGALAEGVRTGARGPKTFYDDPADWYFHGEAGVKWGETYAGRAAAGAWYHTGTFERLGGGTQADTHGWYVLAEQLVWKENPADQEDGQGVGVYVMYDGADDEVNEAVVHFAGGFQWTGLVPTRDEDVLGAGVSWVEFADGAGLAKDHETVTEVFYKAQLTRWLAVWADVQHITNPCGEDVDDAVVGTVRVEVTF